MSRLIKRVPADFDHEGDWPGYTRDCGIEDCDGCDGCARIEPPTGEAWQVWQDVSDGSPISPVFTDRADVAAWLVRNEACAPAAAEAFIEHRWAPSLVAGPFGVFTGVQAAAGEAVHIEHLWATRGESCVPAGTAIRHREYGVTGRVNHRFPPPDGGYYYVTWDRGLPPLLAKNPGVDPSAPMDAGCRADGFEVLPAAEAVLP